MSWVVAGLISALLLGSKPQILETDVTVMLGGLYLLNQA